MKFKRFMLPMLAVVLLGVLAVSCSKERKLLDAIPSTVEQAGVIRLKTAFENAGCKYDDGKAVYPSGIEAPERLSAIVEAVWKLDESGICNPDETAWVVGDKMRLVMTMLVSDKSKFKEITAGTIEWSDETGDYSCGVAGGMSVLLDDNRVWFVDAEPSDAVDVVTSMSKEAEKSSLASMTGIVQLLESDNLLNVVVRQDFDKDAKKKKDKKGAKGENPELESTWATFTCNVKDNRLVGSSSFIEADGTPLVFKGLKEINPAVLAYVPENFNLAFGLGVSPDFDWSIVTKAVGTLGGFQTQAMLSAVTPYLQSIDGTIFLAAGPANSEAYTDLDPGNWHFVMMVSLPQKKINDIMGMMRSSLFMAGVSPKEYKDGVMVIPQYGMNLYMGNVDGYFAVSNMPFESDRQNSLAPIFNGKNGALCVDLPTLKEFGYMLPDFGVKFSMQVNNDNATMELGLNGSDRPI
ncbi:MAG: hypothetical protein K2I31_07100, partial [Duncaniella sp.]|nr:hypothetical protein [Duncaniella sp.]